LHADRWTRPFHYAFITWTWRNHTRSLSCCQYQRQLVSCIQFGYIWVTGGRWGETFLWRMEKQEQMLEVRCRIYYRDGIFSGKTRFIAQGMHVVIQTILCVARTRGLIHSPFCYWTYP
jgi:hypothetical protein